MISFDKENVRFNFRVAGVILHRDRVLLHTTVQDDFWNLPGGRVEMNEDTSQTIVREIKEELNVDAYIERLAFVREDFFEYDHKSYHEIGFYYVLSLSDEEAILHHTGDFYGVEDNGRLIFRWFPIETLHEIEVYPDNLRIDLLSLKQVSDIKHYIDRQTQS